MNALKYIALISLVATVSVSCQKEEEKEKEVEPTKEVVAVYKKYLYATSGLCYSGNGVTTFTAATASNLLLKIDANTGMREGIIADYYAQPAASGDTPISAVDLNTENLLVLVRNGNTARLETVPKKGGGRNNFGTSPAMSTLVTTGTQGLIKSSDSGLLFSRLGTIEKLNASGVKNAAVFVAANLGATCGTTNALYSAMTTSVSGRVITANAAASPNNRVIVVPAAGASGSCDAGLAAPAPTAVATAMVFDRAHGKLIVAYAGPTVAASVNSIHVYDFNETTGAMTNDRVIYDASLNPATYNYLLFGISAMALDEEAKYLYVGTAITTAVPVSGNPYAIERLRYDASKIDTDPTKTLIRDGTMPFYNYGVDTKCISSLVITSEAR